MSMLLLFRFLIATIICLETITFPIAIKRGLFLVFSLFLGKEHFLSLHILMNAKNSLIFLIEGKSGSEIFIFPSRYNRLLFLSRFLIMLIFLSLFYNIVVRSYCLCESESSELDSDLLSCS